MAETKHTERDVSTRIPVGSLVRPRRQSYVFETWASTGSGAPRIVSTATPEEILVVLASGRGPWRNGVMVLLTSGVTGWLNGEFLEIV